jgi:pilus assembly protein CpaB
MKRISPGTVTVGVLAILFGLVTAYVARRYFEAPAAKTAARPTATVVIPRLNLPKYSRVRAEDVDAVEIPVADLPEGAVTMKSRAVFRLVKDTILAGQPILEKDLYGVGEVPKLADELPPGYRAVTLSVDANSALNGMIQPGSVVDISMTVKNEHPEVGGLATMTVMRSVRVLATSSKRFPQAEDRPGNLRNITVAVTPDQANKLILAQRYGTLSVTLRSNQEEDLLASVSVEDDDRDLVNPAELLGLPPVPVAERMVKRAQIWRGGTMTEVEFRGPQIEESLNATAASQGNEPTRAVPVSRPQPTPAPPAGAEEAGDRPTASHALLPTLSDARGSYPIPRVIEFSAEGAPIAP